MRNAGTILGRLVSKGFLQLLQEYDAFRRNLQHLALRRLVQPIYVAMKCEDRSA
jgi:hypothetical protein